MSVAPSRLRSSDSSASDWNSGEATLVGSERRLVSYANMVALPVVSPLVYPDNSILSRLSDRTPALTAEAALVRRIVSACHAGRVRLLTSVILRAEVANAPEDVQLQSLAVLALSVEEVPLAPILRVVRRLNRLHLPPTDALHLAAASAGGAKYAVSCDDDWLRRAAAVAAVLGPEPAIVSPAELVGRENL